MKNLYFKGFGSKVAKFTIMGGLIVLVGISACKKDANNKGNNSSTSTIDITEADAARLATNAVIPSTGGFDAQVQASLNLYVGAAKLQCGAKKDTTVSSQSPVGLIPAFAYTLSWNYQLDCVSGIPTQFVFAFKGSNYYADALISSSIDTLNGSLTVSSAGPTATNFSLNGTYELTGKQTLRLGNQKSFSSDVKFTATDVLIDKHTHIIASGKANVTVGVVANSGKKFNFSGVITFTGDNKATLVLNSGTKYDINLN